jgi:hypothetical protein
MGQRIFKLDITLQRETARFQRGQKRSADSQTIISIGLLVTGGYCERSSFANETSSNRVPRSGRAIQQGVLITVHYNFQETGTGPSGSVKRLDHPRRIISLAGNSTGI